MMIEERLNLSLLSKLGDDTNTIISNENRLNGLYKLKSEPSVKARTVAFWDVTLNVLEQK